MQLGDCDEKISEMVMKLQAYDPDCETLIVEEARELVRRSGIRLLHRWDLNSSFMLDQIRRQEKSVSFEDFGLGGCKEDQCII